MTKDSFDDLMMERYDNLGLPLFCAHCDKERITTYTVKVGKNGKSYPVCTDCADVLYKWLGETIHPSSGRPL